MVGHVATEERRFPQAASLNTAGRVVLGFAASCVGFSVWMVGAKLAGDV